MNRRPPLSHLLALPLALTLAAPAPAQQAAPKNTKAANAAAKSDARVTLNFVNADIEAVTRAMGAMLNRQMLVDPRVKGSITVYSETPLTVREA
jgi:general secretion pathway protein D